MHMNNGRYLSITDIAVIDFMIRTGVYSGIRKRGWIPVVAHKDLSVYSMLKFPDAYEVVTQLLGWTDKYICIRYEFIRNGKLAADSLSIGRIRGAKGSNPNIQELIETLDLNLSVTESPALSQDCLDRIARLEEIRAKRSAARAAGLSGKTRD